jgi:hypothetical protein
MTKSATVDAGKRPKMGSTVSCEVLILGVAGAGQGANIPIVRLILRVTSLGGRLSLMRMSLYLSDYRDLLICLFPLFSLTHSLYQSSPRSINCSMIAISNSIMTLAQAYQEQRFLHSGSEGCT